MTEPATLFTPCFTKKARGWLVLAVTKRIVEPTTARSRCRARLRRAAHSPWTVPAAAARAGVQADTAPRSCGATTSPGCGTPWARSLDQRIQVAAPDVASAVQCVHRRTSTCVWHPDAGPRRCPPCWRTWGPATPGHSDGPRLRPEHLSCRCKRQRLPPVLHNPFELRRMLGLVADALAGAK